MQRCSKRAYALCPERHLCGNVEDTFFAEGSECAAFNRAVEGVTPRKVKCQNCSNLTSGWCEEVIDSPDPGLIRDCQHFRQKTNADRIRAMSDEELAQYFGRAGLCPLIKRSYCGSQKVCSLECVVRWLRQPVEEVPG